jgi:hypothetical protein
MSAPVINIDPEDREQVERLTMALRKHRHHGLVLDEGSVAAALREFAKLQGGAA